MASKETEECRHSETDAVSVARLVYDVLVYTLPKCGLPETVIPPTDYETNVYESPLFLHHIGGYVLGISLVLRDGLKREFQSRKKKRELNDREIAELFAQGYLFFALATKTVLPFKTLVIRVIAMCNELILFLYTEGVSFDINLVIILTSYLIFRPAKEFSENLLITLQETFSTDLILTTIYFIWVCDFIRKFHITYRSEEVSDIFREEFMKPITSYLKGNDSQVMPIVEEVKDFLGFLSSDFAPEKLKDPPKDAYSALGSNLMDPVGSPEPANSAANTVCGAAEKEKRRGFHRSYRQIPGQTSQKGHTSKSTSELGIEDILAQMSLGVEGGSQESLGAIPKRGRSVKKARLHKYS